MSHYHSGVLSVAQKPVFSSPSHLLAVFCFKRAVAPHSVRGATLQSCCAVMCRRARAAGSQTLPWPCVCAFFSACLQMIHPHGESLQHEIFYRFLLAGIFCLQGAIAAHWLTSSVWCLCIAVSWYNTVEMPWVDWMLPFCMYSYSQSILFPVGLMSPQGLFVIEFKGFIKIFSYCISP